MGSKHTHKYKHTTHIRANATHFMLCICCEWFWARSIFNLPYSHIWYKLSNVQEHGCRCRGQLLRRAHLVNIWLLLLQSPNTLVRARPQEKNALPTCHLERIVRMGRQSFVWTALTEFRRHPRLKRNEDTLMCVALLSLTHKVKHTMHTHIFSRIPCQRRRHL